MGSREHALMDQLQLYNSVSCRIELFRPAQATITLYVCGITPDATTHLGQAFTYAMADILSRFLEHEGYPVCYVQNLTDIDDAIPRWCSWRGEKLANHWAISSWYRIS